MACTWESLSGAGPAQTNFTGSADAALGSARSAAAANMFRILMISYPSFLEYHSIFMNLCVSVNAKMDAKPIVKRSNPFLVGTK
jgi:hypothetical protein